MKKKNCENVILKKENNYGIQNIKRVIRKYNGTYLVKKEDVYKLMISFPLDVGNVKI